MKKKMFSNLATWRLCVKILLGVLGTQTHAATTAEPLPECNARFMNTNGWTGADVASTVPLDGDRTLWLFGDTWVGPVVSNRHVNAKMVNSSVAIQQGRNLATAKLEFFWGQDQRGKPAALFAPADSRGFFWLSSGVWLTNRLHLFVMRIEKTGGDGAFAFRNTGNWLLTVTNPAAPPTAWKTLHQKIPFGYERTTATVAAVSDRRRRPEVAATTDNGIPHSTLENKSVSRRLTFGAATLQHDGWIYIFGCDEDRRPGQFAQKHAVIARAPEQMLADFARWQFWDGRAWQSDFEKTTRIFDRAADEYSVSWIPALRKFVAICTPNGLSAEIQMRQAPAASGPWSKPTVVYRCPEFGQPKGTFCYAAKGHPEISATNELLITYATNTGDFWFGAAHADIYVPRCIRVRLKPD